MKFLPLLSILLLIIAILMRIVAAGMHSECFKLNYQTIILEKINRDHPEIFPKELRLLIKWNHETSNRKTRLMDGLHFYMVIPAFFGFMTGVEALLKRRPTRPGMRVFYTFSFVALLCLSILLFMMQV